MYNENINVWKWPFLLYFVWYLLYMFWILVTVIHWHIRYVYNSQEKIDPQWPRPQLTIHSVHTQPTQKGCVVSNDPPLHTPKLAIVFLLLSPPASTHSAHRHQRFSNLFSQLKNSFTNIKPPWMNISQYKES